MVSHTYVPRPYGIKPKGTWEAQDKYNHSPKGLARAKSYRNTSEAKAKRWEYNHRPEIIQHVNQLARIKKQNVRLAVLEAYGGKCVCCGETRTSFLAMDHIDGGGRKDIAKHGYGLRWYTYLKNNHPDHVQILCHNCNMAKGLYGGCPHQDVNNIFVFDSESSRNRISFVREN